MRPDIALKACNLLNSWSLKFRGKSISNAQLNFHYGLNLSLNTKTHPKCKFYTSKRNARFFSSDGKITFGDIVVDVKAAKHPEYVPIGYVSGNISQYIAKHLKWMAQKDLLGQDIFLIGPPGPLRRFVAMQYLELLQKEVEYVSLSRDTTEFDLKQRREIKQGTVHYIDQCAVRAALEGRVLVVDGIEKAERNVLPVLNNLLENREMQLEDGRFLVAASHYDKLLGSYSRQELDSWKLVRVSEHFRVIALGLPVPRYQGNPLDPPLRSRFQARNLSHLPFKEQMTAFFDQYQNIPPDELSRILSFSHTLVSEESAALNLPDFPMDNLPSALEIMNRLPQLPAMEVIGRLYPYRIFLGKEGRDSVEDSLKKFELYRKDSSSDSHSKVVDVELKDLLATVHMDCHGENSHLQVVSGDVRDEQKLPFVATTYHDVLLSQIMQSHSAKDFCLIGPKGCGKSLLIRKFAQMLGYEIEPIMLYQDMTSRDLLQQRTTLPNGDTIWRYSPLVKAAMEGKLAVLDGIHRINPGTIAVVHRLVHDRELQLYDGTRLLRHDRYDSLRDNLGFTDVDLSEKGIFKIHPSFRIVALAEPPVVGSSSQQWLNTELLTLFLYHTMRPLSLQEEQQIVQKLGLSTSEKVETVLRFVHELRNSTDPTLQSVATSLSTRQLLRISRRLLTYPEEDVGNSIQSACLARFLPSLAKSALNKSLLDSGILKDEEKSTPNDIEQALSCEVKDGVVRIGKTVIPLYNPETLSKVPNVLFYDIPQHLSVMETMLKDFLLGEHLLLVGNQGVGKNKIVDRFLNLLNRPREYIQLHRDTTVQTLTLQPTVQDGVIVYEDSPLVRAVKMGHILVIDEADKAPAHVTCILKTLVESGEMILADGRRIVLPNDPSLTRKQDIIKMHPDFRMIVLANRPGFPFLGNDFFASLGDIFSCHAIDNPDFSSEMMMLRQYGPKVPDGILFKLVQAFGELRNMADGGQISYPYSTREVVNIVKHLEKFPDEGLNSVIKNVFDFDTYNKETQETVVKVLNKHGIPLNAQLQNIHLAKEFNISAPKLMAEWSTVRIMTSRKDKDRKSQLKVRNQDIGIKGPIHRKALSYPLNKVDSRAVAFTEQTSNWILPMSETNIIADVAVAKSNNQFQDLIFAVTCNPTMLYSMSLSSPIIRIMDIHDFFPSRNHLHYLPQLLLAPLGEPMNGSVILHDSAINKTLLLDPNLGSISVISRTLQESLSDKISRRFPSTDAEEPNVRMCPDFSENNIVLFYSHGGSKIGVVDLNSGDVDHIEVPFTIKNIHPVSVNHWLLSSLETDKSFLIKSDSDNGDYVLSEISQNAITNGTNNTLQTLNAISLSGLDTQNLSKALGEVVDSPNRILTNGTDSKFHAALTVGFPDLESANSVYGFEKDNTGNLEKKPNIKELEAKDGGFCSPVFLPDVGQVINILPSWKINRDDISNHNGNFFEIVDLPKRKLRYVPIPLPHTRYATWLANSDHDIVVAPTSDNGLVTVDAGGCVRLWETSGLSLQRSLTEWKRMIGNEDKGHVQITVERKSGRDVKSPKHGKVDPTNAPHIGGGTWAGGTGGGGTAGLGGKGGPYRLDAGHTVYQVSDEEKDAVPLEVRKAAREMAQQAFKRRLEEIKMSAYDADLYERYSANVRKEVRSLRVILESLQAKGKERQWLRHQSSGELDDGKLVEGITGEKNIFKRRGEKEPEPGSPQQLPKILKLVVDVSGSMYRFNGYDGRLDRVMESALMLMEAFDGFEQKFKYDIIGHSGEDFKLEFTKGDTPPKNNKERLEILKVMHAHSQFCMSGDSTLPAAADAIKTITATKADEHFVVVLSDANFERYGISPRRFAQILTSDNQVHAYAIFIGSLGDQAQRLSKSLPAGQSFTCLDTKDIPQVLQRIFTSSLLAK